MARAVVVPRPQYPNKLDTLRELFKVYDSSDALLAEDLEPNGRTITLVPRDSSRGSDIWGENGFVTIEQEVVYYDSVSLESVDIERTISPNVGTQGEQVYYLSQARQESAQGEILHNVRSGREATILNPELLSENLISTFSYTWKPTPTLSSPYSTVGRVRISDTWYTFVTKGSGGLINTGSEVYPTGSGISSITLSSTGITIFSSGEIELVEIDYYYAPKRREVVSPHTLSVTYDEEMIIQDGARISSLINDFTLDSTEGILTINWNSTGAKTISTDFKSGLVLKLENCIRGYLTESDHHSAGTKVSGYVMADHHNNLVLAATSLEEYLLSLESSIDELEELQTECNPECPSGEMGYRIIEETETTDCTIQRRSFLVEFTLDSVNATGNRLFFGDGDSEENVTTISHRYLPGSSFSPTAYFRNERCEEYVSEGEEADAPDAFFDTILPTVPEIFVEAPAVAFPDLATLDFQFPTDIIDSVTPGIGIGEIGLPDEITFGEIDLPSAISVVGIPSFIPTIITVTIPSVSISIPPLSIPTEISIPLSVPTEISIVPPIPTEISIVPSIPSIIQITPSIPTEINIIPSIPTSIEIYPELPTQIEIVGDIEIPTSIEVISTIPTEIGFKTEDFPTEIRISVAVSTDNISGNCFKLVPCTV